MTIEEYIQDLAEASGRIASLERQLAAVRRMSESPSYRWHDGMKVKTSKQGSAAENNIVRVVDLEAMLQVQIDRYLEQKQEFMQLILQIHDPVHAELLNLRYVCNSKWDDIADTLSYSYRHVLRMHKEAMSELRTIYERTKESEVIQ